MHNSPQMRDYDSLDSIGVLEFFKNKFNHLESYITSKEYGEDLLAELKALQNKVTNPDVEPQYIGNDDKQVSLLNVLLQEGLIPTYSFPKNIVNFYVEESTRNYDKPRIKYSPSRDLSLAISDYAPGRFITIDKKTYKSGGIYANPRPRGFFDKQAEYYFNGTEHIKNVYFCDKCNWFGEQTDKCPYCGSSVSSKTMLKPWGFAPEKGDALRHKDIDEVRTYAAAPYYSHVPRSEELKSSKYPNIFTAEMGDQSVIMVNMGNENKEGFNVCKKCGGASVASARTPSVSQPYHGGRSLCNHDLTNVFLGYQFKTDMAMIELHYNTSVLSSEDKIIKAATETVVEALHQAITQVLEIDYREINCGHILRYLDDGNLNIEIFFYDNLSSGAGYCSQITSRLDDILDMALKKLECECDKNIVWIIIGIKESMIILIANLAGSCLSG